MAVTLKEVQACELNILKEVAIVCEKNGISYGLAYGTFLGAIRHNGFIPWDDDIDIYIKNEDLKNFKKACKKLPKYLFLQDRKTDHGVPWIFPKVRDTRTYMPDTTRDINQGIWIDVFPMVYAAKKDSKLKKQIHYIYKYQSMVASQKKVLIKNCNTSVKQILLDFYYTFKSNIYYTIIKLLQDKKSGKRIALEVEYFGEYSEKEYERVIKKVISDDNLWNNMIKYQFEDTKFYAFAEYDKYLSEYFGDYMTPVKYSHFDDYSSVKIESDK